MVEDLKTLRRDPKDARPIGLTTLKIENCDPTGDCALSCSDCESSSAASCGTCESRNLKQGK